jgi:hypothetical protein
MCAATPTLTAFAGSSCGPVVSARHSGFEQTAPARAAKMRFTSSVKSSRILSIYFQFSLHYSTALAKCRSRRLLSIGCRAPDCPVVRAAQPSRRCGLKLNGLANVLSDTRKLARNGIRGIGPAWSRSVYRCVLSGWFTGDSETARWAGLPSE